MKGFLGNVVAFCYFIFVMSFILLLLIFMPFGFLMEIKSELVSGFAGPNTGASLIAACGFFIGLSLLIPTLRKMYRGLPWLYPLVKILFINLIILCIGLMIMNNGYQVKNGVRHAIYFILMILQIVICRIAMCIYFKFRPARYFE